MKVKNIKTDFYNSYSYILHKLIVLILIILSTIFYFGSDATGLVVQDNNKLMTATNSNTLNTIYEGFGANTKGGFGKPVYRVTNLNDSGPGSFRYAVSQGNRMVVFDVGGEIKLKSDVDVRGHYVTIDAVTAPSPGITLKNYGLRIRKDKGAHNVIVRGIRVRDAKEDGIQIAGAAYNVVLDHVSVHNSGDGNIDVTQTGTNNVTISGSILAEPAGEEKNMLIAFKSSKITLHHNIFIDSRQRNPQVSFDDSVSRLQDKDTTLDMRNNIIWDWRGGYGTRLRNGAKANIVNNYYASNGGDSQDALIVCKGLANDSDCDNDIKNIARAYVSGSFSANGINLDARGTEANPFPAPPVTTKEAKEAACDVLSQAGVRPLDALDNHYINSISIPSCQ